ncbi:MAG: Death-on-curing family protein [Parcubacteria group bacterium GW2011_GWA1_47_9]|nr:MAG: Death-on-curing family protein [Parcubacteria group bacterium GW2011_GWA1_47_9]
MRYLTQEDILLIHSMVIDETGGSHGVRDHHLLASVEYAPRQAFGGKNLYGDLFSKAAVYARDIIMNHPFIDGNKRTGMTAAFVFLEYNGRAFDVREGVIEKFAHEIIRRKLSINDIAAWFKKHSKKL